MDYGARREKRWIRGISEVSNLRSGKTVLSNCVEDRNTGPEYPRSARCSSKEKWGLKRTIVDKLYADVRVQLCAAVEVLADVVVALC